jgi:hypothetical protein
MYLAALMYGITYTRRDNQELHLWRDAVAAEQGLNAELDVFERHKEQWLRSNPGDFVVIAGARVAGFYPDYEAAFRAGIQAGFQGSFLVKQVCAEDPIYLIY